MNELQVLDCRGLDQVLDCLRVLDWLQLIGWWVLDWLRVLDSGDYLHLSGADIEETQKQIISSLEDYTHPAWTKGLSVSCSHF